MSLLAYREPSRWTGEQVADFIEYIGMGRYRRAFVHHAITGRMLFGDDRAGIPRLSESDMRDHLKISVLGHLRDIHLAVGEVLAAWRGQAALAAGSVRRAYVRDGLPAPAEAEGMAQLQASPGPLADESRKGPGAGFRPASKELTSVLRDSCSNRYRLLLPSGVPGGSRGREAAAAAGGADPAAAATDGTA